MHKSQGLTLDKVVLDLSEKDFVAGLSYIGVFGTPSATKRMRNLASLAGCKHTIV
jgi:hypothetical protein